MLCDAGLFSVLFFLSHHTGRMRASSPHFKGRFWPGGNRLQIRPIRQGNGIIQPFFEIQPGSTARKAGRKASPFNWKRIRVKGAEYIIFSMFPVFPDQPNRMYYILRRKLKGRGNSSLSQRELTDLDAFFPSRSLPAAWNMILSVSSPTMVWDCLYSL